MKNHEAHDYLREQKIVVSGEDPRSLQEIAYTNIFTGSPKLVLVEVEEVTESLTIGYNNDNE